jgi:hypothetical protein
MMMIKDTARQGDVIIYYVGSHKVLSVTRTKQCACLGEYKKVSALNIKHHSSLVVLFKIYDYRIKNIGKYYNLEKNGYLDF